MNVSLHEKLCPFCPIITEIETSQQILIKINTKFHENPSGGSPVQLFHADMQRYGRTDVTKLLSAVSFFALSTWIRLKKIYLADKSERLFHRPIYRRPSLWIVTIVKKKNINRPYLGHVTGDRVNIWWPLRYHFVARSVKDSGTSRITDVRRIPKAFITHRKQYVHREERRTVKQSLVLGWRYTRLSCTVYKHRFVGLTITTHATQNPITGLTGRDT